MGDARPPPTEGASTPGPGDPARWGPERRTKARRRPLPFSGFCKTTGKVGRGGSCDHRRRHKGRGMGAGPASGRLGYGAEAPPAQTGWTLAPTSSGGTEGAGESPRE